MWKLKHGEVAEGWEDSWESLRARGAGKELGGQRRKVGEQAYPTRRYPGTVLVFPLSRMSKTAVSAAPKGTSFTHMRFFLDTEASGKGRGGEQGGEKRQEAGKGPKDGSRRSLSRVLFKGAICMAWGSGYIMNGKVIGGESMTLLGAIGTGSSLVIWRSTHGVVMGTTVRVGSCGIR